MTDPIELRQKYTRLIEAIGRAMPPADPEEGPVKRGLQVGPSPQPWKMDSVAVTNAVTAELMSAIGLRVAAEMAGNKAAVARAVDRIDAVARGWCGNDPIIIVIPPHPWPDPDPQPEWWKDMFRRRDDLVSALMTEVSRLQPGKVADAAAQIAVQILQN